MNDAELKPAALYRAGELLRSPAGPDRDWIYCRDTQAQAILPRQDADWLTRCRSFDTLENHARFLCIQFRLGDERIKDILVTLQSLVRAGLMVERESLFQNAQSVAIQERGQISAAGFPTRNRHRSLLRALASYAEQFRAHGRKLELLVASADDNAARDRELRQRLSALKNEAGLDLFFAGREEAEIFAKKASERGGFPEETLRFALLDVERFGMTYGVCRNAVLLHFPESLILMADDDTVCKTTCAPGKGERFVISPEVDPTDFCFYPDFETIERDVPFSQTDVLGLHEELLGRGVAAAAAPYHADGKLEVDGLSPSFFRRLSRGNIRIRATMMGIAGDCGMSSPSYLLTLKGPSRNRLVRSGETYRACLLSRQILRKVTHPTVAESGMFMTICAGFDHRSLLPPFFPVLRNEDALFGSMLRYGLPDAVIGHLNWSILHHPIEESRRYGPDAIIRSPFAVDPVSVLIRNARMMDSFPAGDVEERLTRWGKTLSDIGKLPAAEFEEWARREYWTDCAGYVRRLHELLLFHVNEPDYWAQDLRKHIETVLSAFAPGRHGDKTSGTNQTEGALNRTQRMIRRFGELLIWWPKIVDTSKALREEGIRLGRAV